MSASSKEKANQGRVLVIDNDSSTRDAIEQELSRLGYDVTSLNSAEDAVVRLRSEDYDCLLCAIEMQGLSGIELCKRVSSVQPGVPVLLMTESVTFETAVTAIRGRAYDVMAKPMDMHYLGIAIDRAVQYRRLRVGISRLRKSLATAPRFDDLVGSSFVMQQVYHTLEGAAHSDATVLITGESGTGKELAARALHRMSRRRNGPFIAINCAALPETLLESELFGHAKGAFTDAKTARAGLFVQANKGSIVLDEIGEMPLSMQAKLLRLLQERRVRPVGSDREVSFDARIIAATNRDLEHEVSEGNFREDLYFRINVIPIGMPPLRARGNDVLLLAQHLLDHAAAAAHKRLAGFSPAAAAKILDYGWPGNVRELQNAIERAVALSKFDQITVEDLPDKIRNETPLSTPDHPHREEEELIPLEEVERRHILSVLKSVQGNRTLASRILGLDRKTLYRKLDRWGESDKPQRAY